MVACNSNFLIKLYENSYHNKTEKHEKVFPLELGLYHVYQFGEHLCSLHLTICYDIFGKH